MSESETQTRRSPVAFMIGIGLLVLGGGIFWSLSQQMPPSDPATTVNASTAESEDTPQYGLEGQMAPAFTLKNLQGESVSLADYKGKVVFLNFWATWCEPCKEEMPAMQRLRQKLDGKPFEILAVSLDKDPTQAVPAFLNKTGLDLNFPVLQDSNQELAKNSYRTTGVPESFLIDANGKIVKHVIGSFEWDSPQITQFFEELIQSGSDA